MKPNEEIFQVCSEPSSFNDVKECHRVRYTMTDVGYVEIDKTNQRKKFVSNQISNDGLYRIAEWFGDKNISACFVKIEVTRTKPKQLQCLVYKKRKLQTDKEFLLGVEHLASLIARNISLEELPF